MPSTVLLDMPLAHYITFYFGYLLNFFKSPEMSLLAQFMNLNLNNTRNYTYSNLL